MTVNQLPYLLVFTVLSLVCIYLLFPVLEYLFVRLIGAIIRIPRFLHGDIFRSFLKTTFYNWYVVLILVGLWFILFRTTVGKDIIETYLNQISNVSNLSQFGSLGSLFISILLLSISIWVIPFFLFQKSYISSVKKNKKAFYISTKILAIYATIPFLLVTIAVATYHVKEKKIVAYSILSIALYFILFWLFVWISNRSLVVNSIIALYKKLRLQLKIYYLTILLRILFWVLILTSLATISITKEIAPQYLVVAYLFLSGMIVFRLLYYTAEDGKDEDETLSKIEERVTQMIDEKNKSHSKWFYYPLFFVSILSVLYYYFIPSLEATNTLYILLIVLSFYIIYFDYLRNVLKNYNGKKKIFAFFGIVLFLSMPFLSPHDQFRIAFQESTDSVLPNSTSLTEAVKTRLSYIQKNDSNAKLYIICAMGGGSRAGYISSETLRIIDSIYGKNSLWDRTVCYSTISGGSVGLYTYLKARELNKLEDSGRFLRYVYEKNYNSSGLYGLLIGDALETIFGVFLTKTRSYYVHQKPALGYHDRNERLRREYDYVLDRASHLEKDTDDSYWLRSYYPRKHPDIHEKDDYFKDYFRLQPGKIPIHLVNTFEINNGRRAVLSPFPVGSTEVFPNALLPFEDPNFDSLANQKDIRYREAVNLSELFPYISAASHIGTKSDIQFVDGGYYENYGVSTAIDMYYLLKDSCHVDKKRIKLIMIKNSKQAPDETKEQSVQLTAPLIGAMNAPFVGHANSLLESAKRLFEESNFCVIEFDADSSKVPLTRALTSRHIDSMRIFTDTIYKNQQLRKLLQ